MSLDSAERQLVGALLMGAEPPAELAPEAFMSPKYRVVVEAILWLRDRGVSSDMGLILDKLAQDGRSNAVTVAELAECSDAYKPFHRVSELWAKVLDGYRTRRVLLALGEVQARTRDLDADGLVALAYEKLSAALAGAASNDNTMTIAQVITETAKDAMSRAQDGASFGVPTGLRDLDELMGGLGEGVVTIVAGRPSHGKSSLVRTVADHANAQGFGVHVFSLEDQRTAYGLRLLADHGRVDLGKLRSMKNVTQGEIKSVIEAGNRLKQRKGWLVDDTAGLSASQIATRVRRHKRANGTRLVVVDYVQLMREPTAKRGEKGDEVARAAEGLVQLARSERVAVVVLSQLSRDCEKRDDKRPQLSDLRETGVLEQVAESVVFVMRPEMYLDEHNSKHDKLRQEWAGKGRVIVAKHKNAGTGEVLVQWDGPTATYRDLEKRREW